MRIGVLTGGGDCPGLNGVIRAIVRKAVPTYGDTVIGFRHGWRGILDDETVELDLRAVRGILPRGGTILRSSRTNPYQIDDGPERVLAQLQELDALIAIGGEDTLGVAHRVGEQGAKVVGVPKTIDNDLSATEVTFGFDTAVQTATDAIDRLHTTAESHDRVMVVEVMGRHAGWIALHAGLAGGANLILIPERPFDIAEVCERLQRRHDNGENSSIVVIAEGAVPQEGTMTLQSGDVDAFGHVQLGGVGSRLADEIQERTGYDARVTILGHVLRGGTPTAFDRILATRFGVAAVEAVHDGAFGTMVALQAGEIVRVPIAEAVGKLKTVEPDLYDLASVFLG